MVTIQMLLPPAGIAKLWLRYPLRADGIAKNDVDGPFCGIAFPCISRLDCLIPSSGFNAIQSKRTFAVILKIVF